MHFPGISGHYKLYDSVCIYDVSGVDFAGETTFIVRGTEKWTLRQLFSSCFVFFTNREAPCSAKNNM